MIPADLQRFRGRGAHRLRAALAPAGTRYAPLSSMSVEMLRDVGATLAETIAHRGDRPSIILAVPRRGIVVAHEIARRLRLPLDVALATKVFGPGHHAPPIGAVALGGVVVTDPALMTAGLDEDERGRRFHDAIEQLDDRLAALRGDHPLPDLRGQRVLLVDDAVVTGLTMLAAVQAILMRGPAGVTVATALCGTEGEVRLRDLALIAHEVAPTPSAARRHAHAAAETSVTDEDVQELIADAQRRAGADLYQGLEIDGWAP